MHEVQEAKTNRVNHKRIVFIFIFTSCCWLTCFESGDGTHLNADLRSEPRNNSRLAYKHYLFERIAKPGSSMPSSISKDAPPPVEIWVIWLLKPD